MLGFYSFSEKSFSYSPKRVVTIFGTRITEDSNFRVTQDDLIRVLEGSNSAFSLSGKGTLSATGSLISSSSKANLLGKGTLTSTADVSIFSTILFVKYQGLWKSGIVFVKHNGIWSIPIYSGKKITGSWKRAK